MQDVFEEVVRNPGLEFDSIAETEEIDSNDSYFNETISILGPCFLSTLPSWQIALAYALAEKSIRVKDKDYKIFVIPWGR